jgi:hypothetical protein
MFAELFGDDFDAIVPIYPARSVDALIHKWDAALARLERAQAALRDASKAAKARAEGGGWGLVAWATRGRVGEPAAEVARLKARIVALSARAAELQVCLCWGGVVVGGFLSLCWGCWWAGGPRGTF